MGSERATVNSTLPYPQKLQNETLFYKHGHYESEIEWVVPGSTPREMGTRTRAITHAMRVSSSLKLWRLAIYFMNTNPSKFPRTLTHDSYFCF